MKKYSKAEAIRILTAAAKDYDTKLCGKCFLICCGNKKSHTYTEFGFQAHNFKHLTGLSCSCSARQFYERARDGRLSPNDFDFDKYGNAHRKLAVLSMLPHMFSAPMLYGAYNNSGIYLSVDYFVGKTAAMLSLGLRHSEPYDLPVSLYCEDIRKLSLESVSVLAVWDKPYKGEYSEPCYVSKGHNAAALLQDYKEANHD